MQPLIPVTEMNLKLRAGSSEDAKTCGENRVRAIVGGVLSFRDTIGEQQKKYKSTINIYL